MPELNELIKRCIDNDPVAQKDLYDLYAPKMWMVCMRFGKNQMMAKDLMQEGFIRIFTQLDKYNGQGSFEAWMRRVIVNTSINYYKKNLQRQKYEVDADEAYDLKQSEASALDKISSEELLKLLEKLPDGYRMVFNLYAIEGYSHKEIADMMGITESTSKSQLSRARSFMQDLLKKHYKIYSIYERT